MPTYDFMCHDCKSKFSLFVSLSEKDKTTCPNCGGPNVTQLFTGFLYSKPGGGQSGSSGGCSGGSCGSCSGC